MIRLFFLLLVLSAPLLLTGCGSSDDEDDSSPTGEGEVVYNDKCSICHALGTYDPVGSPDLSGKGSLVTREFPEPGEPGEPPHSDITLSAREIKLLIVFLNNH